MESTFNEFALPTLFGILNCIHDWRKGNDEEKKILFNRIINLTTVAIDFQMIVRTWETSFKNEYKFMFDLEEIVLKRLNKLFGISYN